MSRPTGTVTFLFTDVEGSTKRWEETRDSMRGALTMHDRIMQKAIATHGGSVFKTGGDAFCAAFATAREAVAAALDAQRALHAEDFSAVHGIRVRMAIHTGTADEREADYFGPALNRVARLLAIAYGEQVLVSRPTADLLQGEMPPESCLRDLGEHRLKDLALPEHVYQLVAQGLPDAFPPLRSLEELPNNLPPQLTSFVGRDEELAEIKKLIDEHRLVTLVGTGGAGKTRCAIQAGAELLEHFSDGVWLAELAPISDASLVPAAIARVLGIREEPERSLTDTLLQEVRHKQLLLIIDNCEHVIGAVRSLASAILHTCPGVRILATSLESLSVAGERVFRLPSLTVPAEDGRIGAQEALHYGAIALFADRALAADGRFTLTDENARSVIEICRRLDGIPLAIELAAARIRVLSPQQLARRLDERFRVLTGGDRTALPRHQTMRALIDWSYDLLLEQERALFRELSIFADGFTLEGASAVCGDERCDEIAVLDRLSSLVDKSLVQTGPASQGRYRLLESTRQYAREKLGESGEFESCADRHLAYIRDLFRRSGDEYETTPSGAAVACLTAELEDARASLDWAVRRHDLADAIDLFLATRLWTQLGLHREAIERAKRFLALVNGDDTAHQARLWERVAFCAAGIGHIADARDAAEKAMRYARAANDPGILADCLVRYADVMGHVRHFDEAIGALDEAEKLGMTSPRRRLQALQSRGLIASISGDLQTAARCFAEVRDLYASLGNDYGAVTAALGLAETEHARGATAEAIEIATNALAKAELLPDRSIWAFLMRNLAGYHGAIGDVAAARRCAAGALAFYAKYDPDGAFTAIVLEHLALCLASDGELESAAMLEGYVEKTLTRLGFEREYTEQTTHQRLTEILAKNISDDELKESLERGERMAAAEALASAVSGAPV